VPSASGKKKTKKHAADRKYGGLESARPDHGRRVSSTRYTSEPRKDNPRSGYAVMSGAFDPPDSAAKAEKNVDELQSPDVAENDYLLPQSGASPTAPPYIDVVADSGDAGTSSFTVWLLCYYVGSLLGVSPL